MHLQLRINESGFTNRVTAVKIIRALTGLGLRESKNFVDDTIAYRNAFHELDTIDEITQANLSNLPGINMDIRQAYDFNIINIDRNIEQPNSNQDHVIIRCREFLLDNMIDLMNNDAPEVLQSAVILFNTINKHIKQHPVLFNV